MTVRLFLSLSATAGILFIFHFHESDVVLVDQLSKFLKWNFSSSVFFLRNQLSVCCKFVINSHLLYAPSIFIRCYFIIWSLLKVFYNSSVISKLWSSVWFRAFSGLFFFFLNFPATASIFNCSNSITFHKNNFRTKLKRVDRVDYSSINTKTSKLHFLFVVGFENNRLCDWLLARWGFLFFFPFFPLKISTSSIHL